MQLVHLETPYVLHSHPHHLARLGPLYGQYRIPRYYFFLLFLAACFCKAIFIAFAKGSGLAQVILLLIVEISILAGLVVLRPHKTRGADVLSTYLAIVRMVCTGLMIAFVEQLSVAAIPRVVIGIIMAVVFSISVIVMVINLALHAGLNRLFRRRSSARSPSEDTDGGILEKGDITPSLNSSSNRPMNPLPERNMPLDPNINAPYPLVTPSTTSGHLSTHMRDSASTTFGSILPRRWSFTPQGSPSDSSNLGAESTSTISQTLHTPSTTSHHDNLRQHSPR